MIFGLGVNALVIVSLLLPETLVLVWIVTTMPVASILYYTI